jgi:hypothetical protein
MKTIITILIMSTMLFTQENEPIKFEEKSANTAFAISMGHFFVPLGLAYIAKEGATPLVLIAYSLTASSAAGFLHLDRPEELFDRAVPRFLLSTVSTLLFGTNLTKVLQINLGLCVLYYVFDYSEINKIVKKHNKSLAFNLSPVMDIRGDTNGIQLSLNF